MDFVIFYTSIFIILIIAVKLSVKYSRISYWKMIDSIFYISILIFVILILIGIVNSNNKLILLSLPVIPIFYMYINIITPRKTSIRVKFIESRFNKEQKMNLEYLDLNNRISRLVESKKLLKEVTGKYETKMSLLLIFATFVYFLRKIYSRGLNF
jgi:hypothetical protein